LKKRKSCLVRVDVADARASLYGHVADRHALVHRHPIHSIAGVLVRVTTPCLHAKSMDDRQNHILRVHATRKRASDTDAANLHRFDCQALRRQDVPHLRGADAERDGAKCAMSGRVTIAARDRHARLREAKFRSDHVDDPLIGVVQIPQGYVEVVAVALERRHHVFGHHVKKRALPVARRDDVIHRGEGAFRKGDVPPIRPQRIERLRGRNLVNQMKPDEKLCLTSRQLANGVKVPHLLKQCLSHFRDKMRRDRSMHLAESMHSAPTVRMRWTGGLAVVTLLATAVWRCGGTETITEVAGPDAVKCQTSVSGLPSTFPSSGANATLTVTAARECSWTANSEASWAHVSPTSGTGAGSLTLTVSENSQSSPRAGTLIVNDSRLSLSQAAAPCRIDFRDVPARISYLGGQTSVTVGATEGCSWEVSSSASWLRLGRASGRGDGTIDLIAERNDGAERSATLKVADRLAVVVQDAAPGSGPPPVPIPNPSCTFQIAPDRNSFTAAGGDGTVRVTTLAGCTWDASTGDSWIAITSATRVTGAGEVRYRVARNDSTTARSGVVTVGGRTHSVQQDGATPATPEQVEIKGSVAVMVGSCPGLTLTVSGRIVVTDSETKFKRGSCEHIQLGAAVTIKGQVLADGRIRAIEVEIG
jgi:Domain of unknown function (DUF5666)/Viral BACON domain/Putative binding domain, N-terminal